MLLFPQQRAQLWLPQPLLLLLVVVLQLLFCLPRMLLQCRLVLAVLLLSAALGTLPVQDLRAAAAKNDPSS